MFKIDFVSNNTAHVEVVCVTLVQKVLSSLGHVLASVSWPTTGHVRKELLTDALARDSGSANTKMAA